MKRLFHTFPCLFKLQTWLVLPALLEKLRETQVYLKVVYMGNGPRDLREDPSEQGEVGKAKMQG